MHSEPRLYHSRLPDSERPVLHGSVVYGSLFFGPTNNRGIGIITNIIRWGSILVKV